MTPRPGERWVGGGNRGHATATVEVLRVTRTRVAVRFHGEAHPTWLALALFLRFFKPARSG